MSKPRAREVGVQKGVPTRQFYDLDTSNTILANSEVNGYYGRRNIILNESLEDFRANPIKVIGDNLSYILATHRANCRDFEYLEDYQKGKQDILNKKRANGEQKINNKHVSNFAWEFVNFKKGYYVGKPIKYVDLNTKDNSPILYLNRYNRDVNKASKDLIKYENMLITGIAHTMTIPKRVAYDNEYESPYEYTILDNKDVCVVKSNDIFKTKLFSMCISHMKDSEEGFYYIYTIYYDNVCLLIKHIDNKLELLEAKTMPIDNCITEYQLNEQRMGVFEPVLVGFNSLNNIASNQLDQLEENVNSYLTFENVDTSSVMGNIEQFREKRVLVVETNNPETPAKIGSIKVDIEQTSINKKYSELKQETYDIIGVPMPTSSTGQGVSGEAQVYGGGWENAQTIAQLDTQYIMQYEVEDLDKFIKISRNSINSKTKDLYTSDVEVKYTINKSNNMMTKAQSMTYFVDKGFTREQALTFCEITDDPQNEGKIADENYINQKRLDSELELEKTQKLQEVNSKNENNQEKDI